MSKLMLLVAVLFVASLCPVSSAQTPLPRVPEAWPTGTIFAPLDLPAPNSMRNGAGSPGPAYWQQQADYAIEVELNEQSRMLKGKERITYVNNSPDELDYVWIHLEQNIFRADSIGAQLSGQTAIGMKNASGDGMTVTSVSSMGEALQMSVYGTVARIVPPKTISANGGKFVFDIAWSFVVPDKVFRRFGAEKLEQGIVFELAQWFPAMAVYDDVYGWNTLPYIGTGEFYTNFGSYDVKITVPRSHIVVATGVLQNAAEVFTAEQKKRRDLAAKSDETIVICGPSEVGTQGSRPAGHGPLTWHFVAHKVRTFAFASSSAFILDAASEDGILIQSAYPKEALPLWKKSTQMLKTAIRGYNKRWFPYPYPVATNVNGPEGGMEYPMIIFCGARKSEAGLYGVTTHEIGHNWFPMLVNSDERRHAWMDEGFNSFINLYSRPDWPNVGVRARGTPTNMARFMQQENLEPIITQPDRLNRRHLGMLEYSKPALGLKILREEVLGAERFDFAFKKYIQRWAFKSPRPADFFRLMEDAAGMDLAWFWRGWFLTSSRLDQAVVSVSQKKEKEGAKIIFENRGAMVMPLKWTTTYEDGSLSEHRLAVEIWFSSNHIEVPIKTTKKIVKVAIDPEIRLPDVDRGNNVWSN